MKIATLIMALLIPTISMAADKSLTPKERMNLCITYSLDCASEYAGSGGGGGLSIGDGLAAQSFINGMNQGFQGMRVQPYMLPPVQQFQPVAPRQMIQCNTIGTLTQCF